MTVTRDYNASNTLVIAASMAKLVVRRDLVLRKLDGSARKAVLEAIKICNDPKKASDFSFKTKDLEAFHNALLKPDLLTEHSKGFNRFIKQANHSINSVTVSTLLRETRQKAPFYEESRLRQLKQMAILERQMQAVYSEYLPEIVRLSQDGQGKEQLLELLTKIAKWEMVRSSTSEILTLIEMYRQEKLANFSEITTRLEDLTKQAPQRAKKIADKFHRVVDQIARRRLIMQRAEERLPFVENPATIRNGHRLIINFYETLLKLENPKARSDFFYRWVRNNRDLVIAFGLAEDLIDLQKNPGGNTEQQWLGLVQDLQKKWIGKLDRLSVAPAFEEIHLRPKELEEPEFVKSPTAREKLNGLGSAIQSALSSCFIKLRRLPARA